MTREDERNKGAKVTREAGQRHHHLTRRLSNERETNDEEFVSHSLPSVHTPSFLQLFSQLISVDREKERERSSRGGQERSDKETNEPLDESGCLLPD